MSRLRKIYKGEENWDILFDENDKNFPVNTAAFNNNPVDNTKNTKMFFEDKNNKNAVNNSSAILNNTKTIENKLNNISLNHQKTEKNKYDIDNDNLITEEETGVKQFKFDEFDDEAIMSQTQKNNKKTNNMDITQDDYDMFYQMEMEEEANKNKDSEVKTCYKHQDNCNDNIMILEDSNINLNTENNNISKDLAFGKRIHSEAFNNNKLSSDALQEEKKEIDNLIIDEKEYEIPIKIRKMES